MARIEPGEAFMWTGWGVTLEGDEIDLEDWRRALPEGFEPWIIDAELDGSRRTVLRSSSWEGMTEPRLVFDDASRIVERIKGIMRLSQPDTMPVQADKVYFVDSEGKTHRTLIAVTGEIRARLRFRARLLAQVDGENVQPQQTLVQRLYGAADERPILADLYTYISKSDTYFELYKAMEATNALLGGEYKVVAALGANDGRFWKNLKELLNCHRHHPSTRCIELMRDQPPFEELQSQVIELIGKAQHSVFGDDHSL